ncbi:hypothetical protein [Roseivirga sp. UBA1976]|uniref:hypothetical protein n=1 Tax=Roseivirga sp. UBA1976 TaxID=1947386 RepID=UPI00257A669D|nr:hypothetical protein [Roseivirga sp. UBA1976]|tara:strand:+ start:9231 stop:9398 length:168 start_codon:yes stop_codon:yes gene_type:complete
MKSSLFFNILTFDWPKMPITFYFSDQDIPEMVAQIAPHFVGEEIPPYGKNNLWFL